MYEFINIVPVGLFAWLVISDSKRPCNRLLKYVSALVFCVLLILLLQTIEIGQLWHAVDVIGLVLYDDYKFYCWQPNALKGTLLETFAKTLMVSRLDGPRLDIIRGMVDKAVAAEANGLAGHAYIDSRGLPTSTKGYGLYDQSLRDFAQWMSLQEVMPVIQEQTAALFQPGDCPRTALYCGWYSVGHYINAFRFVDGAVGFHIASYEAVDLLNPRSSEWCPSMIMNGITATLGPVAEPYLQSFPDPLAFFQELCQGRSLVEAFYRTKPFNSWQRVLIGDPRYRSFKTTHHGSL